MSDLTTDRINIILQVNGASSYVNNMRQITGSTDTFNASAGRLMATLSKFISAAVIFNFAKQAKEAWQVQLEAETKLNTILRRNIGATEEQVQVVKDWASELQKVGVIGDEIQLEGLQELSTYIEDADSLKQMNVVLNDMLAQQYGLNATTENAVNIATMLGKVLNGQTSALSRYGYSFTEAQEQLIKFGTEEQKVATLAQVVEASVGGVNEALAKTPAGRLKQISNELGDIKEQFGKAFTNSMVLFAPVLKGVANAFEYISQIAVKISESSVLANMANTIKLYSDAWRQASEVTKNYARTALKVIAVGMIAPKVISIVSKAVKLLTIDVLTLDGALSAITGIASILLMAKAFSDLSKQVKEMKETVQTADTISNIGDSAEVSAGAVGDLSEAMDDLGDAAEGLDTFLASFDEVNKVGGNNSLMSQLVNADDLANILGVADGLGDINSMVGELDSSLNNMELPDISVDSFLDPAWWKQKWENIKKTVGDFLHTFYTGEWKENWLVGAQEIENVLNPEAVRIFNNFGSDVYDIMQPWISKFVDSWDTAIDLISKKLDSLWEKYQDTGLYKMMSKAGSNLYDVIHENDDNGAETFTYTSKSGITSQVLKYNPDGTETELYKNYKAQYNEDGSETELYKRKKKSGSIASRYAAGGLPNKGTLFVAGENGPEFVGNFGGSQTKVVNQSQIQQIEQPAVYQTKIISELQKLMIPEIKQLVQPAQTLTQNQIQNQNRNLTQQRSLSQQYTYVMPDISTIGERYNISSLSRQYSSSTVSDNRHYANSSNSADNRRYTNNNSSSVTNNNTIANSRPQDITLQIDGRKIATVVIDSINNMTRSSGRSPLIELGG